MSSLVDSFGREVRKLRLSVTDRCNFRCTYCLPEEPTWMPRAELLTFEEIERVAGILAPLGVRKLRLTGGEPLVRRDLVRLVARLAAIPGIDGLAMTTNGFHLGEYAKGLRDAGLKAVTVSLDALDPETFFELVRRPAFDRVIAGLDAALAAGFRPIKINCVTMRGINEDHVLRFAEMSRSGDFNVRFIEYMPLDSGDRWDLSKVVPGSEVRARISERWPLRAIPGDGREPASRYEFVDGRGEIGFISSVSEPFCGSCDRIRLTADGKILNCLFGNVEYDVRAVLRDGGDDAAVAAVVRRAVGEKAAGHLINRPGFVKPKRSMVMIGG